MPLKHVMFCSQKDAERKASWDVTRTELAAQLRTWFATLPRKVVIGCDDRTDWDLLLDALDGELPPNVVPQPLSLRHMIDTTAYNSAVSRYHDQPDQPWHHALHDAMAHRAGWLAWVVNSKTDSPTNVVPATKL